ncbi:MAG: hypothetical protein JOY89_24615 [Solirubrobacterales bacterium]|nr:hypothetical protein [Solirubrobacterales bacterium]
MSGLVLAARLVLTVVFFAAGIAKLADLEGSERALRDFGAPLRAARVGRFALPIIELSVAVCLLVPVSAGGSLIASAVLLASFIVVIGISIARGTAPHCHCFGQVHSEPAGWRTLARNGVLAAAAAIALYGGKWRIAA